MTKQPQSRNLIPAPEAPQRPKPEVLESISVRRSVSHHAIPPPVARIDHRTALAYGWRRFAQLIDPDRDRAPSMLQ